MFITLEHHLFFSQQSPTHLETEEISCWNSGRRMLSHFCLLEDSSLSTVLHLLWCIFLMNQIPSIGKSSAFSLLSVDEGGLGPEEMVESLDHVHIWLQQCFNLLHSKRELFVTVISRSIPEAVLWFPLEKRCCALMQLPDGPEIPGNNSMSLALRDFFRFSESLNDIYSTAANLKNQNLCNIRLVNLCSSTFTSEILYIFNILFLTPN